MNERERGKKVRGKFDQNNNKEREINQTRLKRNKKRIEMDK